MAVTLKGKPPSAVEKTDKSVKVSKNKNSHIYIDQRTYNISCKDANVAEALARSFQSMESDKEIKAFTVLDKDRKELINIPRKSFGYLSKQKVEEKNQEKKIRERTVLPIFKAVFDTGYKWTFIFKGFKITANIKDEDFQGRIRTGEKFGRGDALDVELETLKAYDEGIDLFVNKSYNILLVHKIIPRINQPELEMK